ncbi:protein pitchfork isoform X2 [Hemicordylus capensis]|uniref:protein pitchfork isoform X2 n=1 Tax=Hemicordylus capensis TaxID=884348 RepID=UPI002304B5DD|nr:protein pitchfork isoform X2 [Hemicordylus capensis]
MSDYLLDSSFNLEAWLHRPRGLSYRPPYPWKLPAGGRSLKKSAFGMIAGQRQLAWELTGEPSRDWPEWARGERFIWPLSVAAPRGKEGTNPRGAEDAQKRNSFGSCQQKRIFPFFHAPDRLGNEWVPLKGDPNRGPGTYNHAERTNLLYVLTKRPESTKGYALGARTTPRFGFISKIVTPAPTTYQAIWIKEQKHQAAYAPFSSRLPRFSERVMDRELFPGPGTYDPNKIPHRHVTWPGKFGSPDWSLVPMPKKRTLKTELFSDKEFRKHRNLVAYLSIYYDD